MEEEEEEEEYQASSGVEKNDDRVEGGDAGGGSKGSDADTQRGVKDEQPDELALHLWLKQKAGLGGRKLDTAIAHCEAGMVETIADLLKLRDHRAEWKEAFPHAMIRTKLVAALNRQAHG